MNLIQSILDTFPGLGSYYDRAKAADRIRPVLEPIAKVAACLDNEATAYPYWGICEYDRMKRPVLLAGIWFSRDAAKQYLAAKNYNFPKKAFVYCFSGHQSWDFKDLYDVSMSLREEPPHAS